MSGGKLTTISNISSLKERKNCEEESISEGTITSVLTETSNRKKIKGFVMEGAVNSRKIRWEVDLSPYLSRFDDYTFEKLPTLIEAGNNVSVKRCITNLGSRLVEIRKSL